MGTAESLSRLLGQAVQSGDRSLLEEALRVRRENIIRQTLRRLPLSLILPLLRQVSCLYLPPPLTPFPPLPAGEIAGDLSLSRSGAESVGPPSADSALCLPHHTASANGSPFLFLPGHAPNLSFLQKFSFHPLAMYCIVITVALRLSAVLRLELESWPVLLALFRHIY